MDCADYITSLTFRKSELDRQPYRINDRLVRELIVRSTRSKSTVWMRLLRSLWNGRFGDLDCIAARYLLRLRRDAALARAKFPRSASSRKTAIHAKCSQRLQSIRHSDILTTSRYIDVNSKKLSEAVELL
jgi:hypothetical protein